MKPISPEALNRQPANDDFLRQPPHSTEAEMCAIASMMLDRDIAAQIVGMLRGGDFYLTDHTILFDAIAGLSRAGKPIDAVIVRDELKRRGVLDEIGGSAYLAQVLGTVPSAAHGLEYAATVKATAIRRGIIGLADDLIRRAFAGHEDGTAIAGEATRHLLDLSSQGRTDRIHTYGEIIDDAIDRLRNPGKARRVIPSGLREFDRMFGGFPVGLMSLVAARPSMGKSLFVKEIARRVAQAGVAVGIITVEETREVIAEKAIATASGYDNRLIHQGTLREGEREDAIDAVQAWRELPVYVVDDATKLSDILSVAATLRAKYGCEMIIIDHVHRIDGEPGRNDNRTSEVTKISTALANEVAKRLDVALVACAQLNRGTEHTGQKPKMSDLRDSGSLEQDARLVALLYREDYFHKGEEHYQRSNTIEVIVDKNSNGATGVCVLPINLAAQRIEDEGRGEDFDGLYDRERAMAQL